jgi:DNA repair ATPase RecN
MTEEKIKYIEKETNNSILYKIIIENNIPYTKNINGIFVNLSKLDDKNINLLYNSVKNNNFKEIDNERSNLLNKYKKSLDVKNNTIKKVYKKFENLSKTDLEIIKYSKKI